MTVTDQPSVDNGVNVQALLEARAALTDAPEAAAFQWRASSQWVAGTHTRTTIEEFFGLGAEQSHREAFVVDTDHPELFASEDHAMTPVEMVLAGLAGCLTAGIAAVATNRGVQLRSVTATLAGDMDIQGILGIDPEVRNGFGGITVQYDIDADASRTTSRRSWPSRRSARPCSTWSRTRRTSSSRSSDRVGNAEDRVMNATSVVVVGAGPAGLAVSGCLSDVGVDHVVLERHEVGHSWRRERWDSLRTLTPNWMNGLPRRPYRGPDPDGFMTATEVADLVVSYAQSIAAPVVSGTTVSEIRSGRRGYVVDADTGSWEADAVVLAMGPGETKVPAVAGQLPEGIDQIRAAEYRQPGQLGDRVLIVGAAASGVQIADEVVASGRNVTLAVGEHVRLPRTYRGRDVLWWMQAMGVSSRRWDDDMEDLARARQVPSPQLVGTPEKRRLDLATLSAAGVELVGRLVGVHDGRLQCAGSLANLVANADLKQARLLDQVDEFIDETGIAASSRDRPPPTVVDPPRTSLDPATFDTVVWATGHRYAPPQIDPAHLDRWGKIVHDGGRLRAPGLFAIGLPFLRRRSSTFLSGIGRDAVELTLEIRRHLDRLTAAA